MYMQIRLAVFVFILQVEYTQPAQLNLYIILQEVLIIIYYQ